MASLLSFRHLKKFNILRETFEEIRVLAFPSTLFVTRWSNLPFFTALTSPNTLPVL